MFFAPEIILIPLLQGARRNETNAVSQMAVPLTNLQVAWSRPSECEIAEAIDFEVVVSNEIRRTCDRSVDRLVLYRKVTGIALIDPCGG
jgi:hypothetical protein